MALGSVSPPFQGTGDTTPSVGVDTIGGVHYQVLKLAHGVEGALTLASASNPLPVTVSNQVTVTGSVTVGAAVDAAAKVLDTRVDPNVSRHVSRESPMPTESRSVDMLLQTLIDEVRDLRAILVAVASE